MSVLAVTKKDFAYYYLFCQEYIYHSHLIDYSDVFSEFDQMTA